MELNLATQWWRVISTAQIALSPLAAAISVSNGRVFQVAVSARHPHFPTATATESLVVCELVSELDTHLSRVVGGDSTLKRELRDVDTRVTGQRRVSCKQTDGNQATISATQLAFPPVVLSTDTGRGEGIHCCECV